MFSNHLLSSLEDLSAKNCFEIAEYFDAQAQQLRRAGEQKKREKKHSENDEKLTLERQKKLLLSGVEALELVENNVEKVAACSRIATVFGLDFIHVEANFEIAKREKRSRLIKERNKKAHHLKGNGLSIRQIAEELNISKSTVHTILKLERE